VIVSSERTSTAGCDNSNAVDLSSDSSYIAAAMSMSVTMRGSSASALTTTEWM
jgi:hypothetical protein